MIRRPHSAAHRANPMQGNKPQPSRPQTGLSLPLNKSFGQHLLKNPGILDKIIESAHIKSTDTVLEVGPGTGNVTIKLVSLAKQVVALEIDPRMAAEVKKRVQAAGRNNLKVVEGDAIKTTFPYFDVCVANLPYQISSPFVFKLLAQRPPFRCAVVMFQKEFAERLVAQVGEENYGRLAINTQLLCNVTRVCKVSRGSFNPPPEVDSMVVKFCPHDKPVDVNFSEFDGLLRICFNRKNKTLHAQFTTKHVQKILEENYKTYCSISGAVPVSDVKNLIFSTLASTGLADTRAAKIDLEGYLGILLAFNKVGIHFANAEGLAEEED